MKKTYALAALMILALLGGCAENQADRTSAPTAPPVETTVPTETELLTDPIDGEDELPDDEKTEAAGLVPYVFEMEAEDYAERYGLTFSLPEQKELYNLALTFAFHCTSGIPMDEERYGTFAIEGQTMTGWLTGIRYQSYQQFVRTLFTDGGLPQNRLYPYYENRELFLVDAYKGGSEFLNNHDIVYEDEGFVVIRNRAMSVEMQEEKDYYTVLQRTYKGWRVALLEEPNL